MANTAFAAGVVAKLRIFTLVLGFIAIVLASLSVFYNLSTAHSVFYGSSIAVFILSIVFFIGHFKADRQGLFKKFDLGFHCVALLLLIVTGIIFIVNVVRYTPRDHERDSYFAEQLSAGAIGLVNGLLYGVIAALLIRDLQDPIPKSDPANFPSSAEN